MHYSKLSSILALSFCGYLAATAALASPATVPPAHPVNGRSKEYPPLNCKPFPGDTETPTPVENSQEGIAYLKGLNQGCVVGPRSCSRISCSYGAAIELCNDRDDTIAPDCRYLAGYAEDIIKQCAYGDPPRVGGQMFDTDRYNVILKPDDC